MRIDAADIRKLAVEFRKAIEEARVARCFDNDKMKDFPRGCCGDAADLLGEFLLNNGIIDLFYIFGTHYPCTGDDEADFQGIQSHAWISIGNPAKMDSVIVDITGDQFKYDSEYDRYDERVYVGKPDPFHRLFDVEKADVHEYHGIRGLGGAQERLYWLYDEITKRINN